MKFERPYDGTREDRALLHDFVSAKITDCIEQITLTEASPCVHVPDELEYEIVLLKELTWFYVINSPAMASAQEGHIRLIEQLFETLTNWLSTVQDTPRLPRPLYELLVAAQDDPEVTTAAAGSEEFVVRRTVCDFLVTLTEDQAIDLYERITGQSSRPILRPWFA